MYKRYTKENRASFNVCLIIYEFPINVSSNELPNQKPNQINALKVIWLFVNIKHKLSTQKLSFYADEPNSFVFVLVD